jgi:excisionase family DNA binding protein
MEPSAPFTPGLTIGQAASRMGVSPSTVRRRVRSGQLRSERVTVGDGFEYRIPTEDVEAAAGSMNPSVEPAANGSTNASAPSILEASVERSTALAAYNAELLGPLLAVIERQQDTIREQAEELGRLRERLATPEPSKEPAPAPVPEPSPYPAPTDPPRNGHEPPPWWRRWWAWLAE